MSWVDTLVIGHDSSISMDTPQAFDLSELKNILWGVVFWYSCSVSIEILVPSRRKILEWDLFMLFNKFFVFFYSPREQTFQDVSFILSSGDFELKGFSSIIWFACVNGSFRLMFFYKCICNIFHFKRWGAV